jgi:hypothetical protein
VRKRLPSFRWVKRLYRGWPRSFIPETKQPVPLRKPVARDRIGGYECRPYLRRGWKWGQENSHNYCSRKNLSRSAGERFGGIFGPSGRGLESGGRVGALSNLRLRSSVLRSSA